MTRPSWVGMLAAVAIAAALGACGSDDNGDGEPAASVPRSSERPTDARVAQDSLLTRRDLPPGWDAGAPDAASDQEHPCAGIRSSRAAATANETSPIFLRDNDQSVGHRVLVFEDRASAGRAFEALNSGDTRRCVAGLVGSTFAGSRYEVDASSPAISELSIAPAGDKSAASRVTLPLTNGSGSKGTVTSDIATVQQGRVIGLIQIQTAATQFDEDLRAQLLTTLAERAATAQGR